MPIRRASNYDYANDLLTRLNREIEHAGSNGLLSGHVHGEGIFEGILNALYGYNLRNANEGIPNAAGIDLIDDGAQVVIQVTGDWSSKKMNNTLASPAIADYAEKGYRLKFCYIGEQKDATKRRTPPNPHNIAFDAKRDVILTKDLLDSLRRKGVDEQEAAIALLKKELGDACLLTQDLLERRLAFAIEELGPRYAPQATVETPDMQVFDALMSSAVFWREFDKRCEKAQVAIEKLFRKLNNESGEEGVTAQLGQYLAPLRHALEKRPQETASISEFGYWAASVYKATAGVLGYPNYLFVDEGKARKRIESYDELQRRVYDLHDFCRSHRIDCLATRSLLLLGEAGVGKSHLLADMCARHIAAGGVAVLALGSWFYDPVATIDVIPRRFGFKCDIDEFLDEVSRLASVRETVGIVAIDALNEGAGQKIWRHELPLLIEKARERESIRLVLSLRTTYINQVLPDAYADEKLLPQHYCTGFADVPGTAIRAFCDQYNISYISAPIMGAEVSNPLYLKMLCSYLASTGESTFSEGASLGRAIKMAEVSRHETEKSKSVASCYSHAAQRRIH